MTRWFIAALLALLILAPPASASAGQGVEVRLRARSEVLAGGDVRLGDVAEIRGGSLVQKKRLSGIVLAAAPRPGTTVHLGRRLVRTRLRKAGLRGVRLAGPPSVQVRLASRTLGADEVRAAVRRFLAGRMSLRKGEAELREIRLPSRRITLPRQRVEVAVEAPANTRFVGRVPLLVRLRQRGKEIRRFWVKAEIAVLARVPVLRRPVRKGQRLDASFFELRRRDLSAMPGDLVTRSADLDGAVAQRPLAPGESVRRSDVKLPYLVRQGNLVRILARRGKLSIHAVGKALDPGRKGDVVRIVNIDSNKVVQGRVLDRASVEVLF